MRQNLSLNTHVESRHEEHISHQYKQAQHRRSVLAFTARRVPINSGVNWIVVNRIIFSQKHAAADCDFLPDSGLKPFFKTRSIYEMMSVLQSYRRLGVTTVVNQILTFTSLQCTAERINRGLAYDFS